MNRVRSFGFLLALFLALGVGAGTRASQSASSPGSSHTSPPRSPASPDAIENDETLNLTPEQKDKISSIREDAKKQIQEIEKDKTLTDDQRTRKTKQVTKETRAQVFAVLTPEQQKTWSAEQRERRQEKRAAK
ncbi:MAG: hypothetical protein WB987_08125 [Candidatus Acidiferrales bacterium]